MSVPQIARLRAKVASAVASAGVAMATSGRQVGGQGSPIAGPAPNFESASRPFVLTMITAIRPGCQRIVRGFFSTARQIDAIQQPLIDLAVIRAAYWTVVEELPDGDGGSDELRPSYLLFESTYDCDLQNYIDIFARRLPWQMRGIWVTGAGYPGILPSSAFHRWVKDHSYTPDHSWLAYPEATTRMVASGLRVAERLRAFDAAVTGCDDEEFAFEFQRMLVELQEDI
jgi:hypothetical protein